MYTRSELWFPYVYLDNKLTELGSGGRSEIALLYPGSYPEGMSSLGFQQVLKLFRLYNLKVHRFFYDRAFFDGRTYRSPDSGYSIKSYDIVAVSASYELDLIRYLKFMLEIGVNPLDRKFLTILGGPITYINPRPFEPFFDLIVSGDGEVKIPKLVNYLSGGSDISEEELYRKEFETELNPIFSAVLSPHAELKDMFLVLLNRGCPFRCAFCSMGYDFGPPRYVNVERIIELLELFKVKLSGAKSRQRLRKLKVGFITSSALPPGINELLKYTMESGFQVSFSSLRVETISPSLVRAIVEGGQRSVTLAPETGSDELRYKIGKRFSNLLLLEKLKLIRELGIANLKLYFMIGLPDERETHIMETVKLIRAVHNLGFRRIRISVSQFVPKPHTSLADKNLEPRDRSSYKLKLLTEGIRDLKGVSLSYGGYRTAQLEYRIAFGSQELGLQILKELKLGGRLKL